MCNRQNSLEKLATDRDDLVAYKFLDCGFVGRAKCFTPINQFFFDLLSQKQIPNYFIAQADDETFVASNLKDLPFEVIVRNFAAGSCCERLSVNRGTWFPFPYLEYFVNDESKQKKYYSENEFFALDILSFDEICLISDVSREISKIVYDRLLESNLMLVDIRLSFSKDIHGGYFVSGELTPDKMRILDKDTKESYDFDAYFDCNDALGNVCRQLFEKLDIKV